MFKIYKEEIEVNGKKLTLETGKIARQADGAIIAKQGETVEESVMVTEEAPAAPVQKLTYNELRNRLPKEITDDVVALISNSEQALQDFAYIRTQGDVDSFNVKYGVNLVLPQTA